jgi:hypothetical protein
VDGSPGVLAEMKMLEARERGEDGGMEGSVGPSVSEEDSEEGSSDTEVSGQKRGRALRRLGEKVRRLTRSL